MKNFIILILIVVKFSIADAQEIKSIKRVSLSPNNNNQGISYSYDPEIDGSGRYIMFTSTADNFAAAGNPEGVLNEHTYLRDVLNGTTTQLDVTAQGETGSPSHDFNPNIRTFGSSQDPHISRDGQYAVFTSAASDISPDGLGEQFGNWAYIKNLQSGEIKRIPYATQSMNNKFEYPTYLAINSDGSVVVVISIISDSQNPNCTECGWGITIYDRVQDTTVLLDTGIVGNKFNPGISDDGRFIVFENQIGDFNAATFSYLYDRTLSQLTSLNAGNVAQSPAISGDGMFIAYADTSDIPTVIKLLERESSLETVISKASDGSSADGINEFPSIDQNGRYIAFLSTASNLVANDSNGLDDIFVYDRISGKTVLVSVQAACNSGFSSNEQFNTGPPAISSDGKIITFTVLERLIPADVKDSSGNVKEPADSNVFDDVYVVEIDYDAKPEVFRKTLRPGAPLVSVNCTGSEARLQLEPISTSNISQGKIKKILQQIVIQKISNNSHTKTVKTLNAKKLQLTAKNLPIGNYSAQVKVQARYSNGKIVVTKPSRTSNFTITK